MYRFCKILTLGLFFIAPSVFSLSVESINGNNGNGSWNVILSNTEIIDNKDIYVFFVNLDAKNTQQAFLSWQQGDKWVSGLHTIQPESAVTIPAFLNWRLASLQAQCATEERCFVAALVTTPNANPLQLANWLQSSIIPLTKSAAQERFPGQRFFLASGGNDCINCYPPVDEPVTSTDIIASPAPEAPLTPETETNSNSDTLEKSDIVKKDNNTLLFANNLTKQLQYIDVSDSTAPQLLQAVKMTGIPKELFIVNSSYYLFEQIDNTTQIQVLKNNNNSLQQVQNLTLAGQFLQGRRKNNTLYIVTQVSQNNCNFCEDIVETDTSSVLQTSVQVYVLTITDEQLLVETEQYTLQGYQPHVALFNDYLVIAIWAGWPDYTSQVHIFHLLKETPLHALNTIDIVGYIPSEFHLDVRNNTLRLVSSPENRDAGSQLLIYDLTLQTPKLLSFVNNIAPGEQLYATRFSDDKAFVVTFERIDPLWVINLSDPEQPWIEGELEVPGWSEKLFFYEQQLLGLGIDNQRYPEDAGLNGGINRVSLGLFDISNAADPQLLSRITPLIGESTYSYSPAINDERALFLDWKKGMAALPIQYRNNALQFIQITSDALLNLGKISVASRVERTLALTADQFATLGGEDIFIIDLQTEQPIQIGHLSLAQNIYALNAEQDKLFAAVWKHSGYQQVLQFDKQDIENIEQQWQLEQAFYNIAKGKNWRVFFNTVPFQFQAVNITTGDILPVYPEVTIAGSPTPVTTEGEISSSIVAPFPVNYEYSEGIVQDNILYITEKHIQDDILLPFESGDTTILDKPTGYNYWLLRRFQLTKEGIKELTTLTAPGKLLAITTSGELFFKDFSDKVHLYKTQLMDNALILEKSIDLTCNRYSYQLLWADQYFYFNCSTDYPIYYLSSDAPIKAPDGDMNVLLQLDMDLVTQQQHLLSKPYQLISATAQQLLLQEQGNIWINDPPIFYATTPKLSPPIWEGEINCEIYNITAEKSLVLLYTLPGSGCLQASQVVFDAKSIYFAQGYEGIKHIYFDESKKE